MNSRELLTLLSSSTGLILHLPGMYTRYYFARRRALKTFKKELINNGIPWETAEELSKLYPDLQKNKSQPMIGKCFSLVFSF